MVLPDTSVWVAYLRPGSHGLTQELDVVLEKGDVVMCGPVLAELLAGARPKDRPTLLATLSALPWADLDRTAWRSVGLLAAALRDQGTALPLTDLEIAVAAQGEGATLWTADRDFERLRPLMEGLDLRTV